MTKILFICLGNICRSPMAEAMMRHLAAEAGRSDDFEIASAAVSEEEWGNPIYPPAANILRQHGIPYDGQRIARQMKASDYEKYDLIIAMDEANIRGINRIAGGDPDEKIHLLLDYAGEHRNVADPWYTRDFETAYDDILTGCRALLAALPCSKAQ
jgi:protein-tyrosine phosphatase